MVYLSHSKGLQVRIFYARHSKELEKQINDFLKENNITVISWITKMELDKEDKPHFYITIIYKKGVVKNAI